MASLASGTTARVSNSMLVQLTRADDTGDNTVDTVKLGLACDDVIGDFRTYAGLLFDVTDSRHLREGVRGVVLTLQDWKTETDAAENLSAWQQNLKDNLRLVTHNNRIRPTTDSTLDPTERRTNSRPDFDRSRLADIIPETLPNLNRLRRGQ